METISVIVTSYNQQDELRAALESVRAQTLPAHEILVCDDASTDGSPDLIRAYASRYPDQVKPVLQPTNVGISRNRNAGLEQVSGGHVAWLDGDDVFEPTKLEQEARLLRENPLAGWAYSQVRVVLVDQGKQHDRYAELPDGDVFDRVVFMLGQAPRNPLVTRAAIEAAGRFDPSLEMYEDFDLLLRLARRFPCASCAAHGMEYRVHGGGMHRSDPGKHVENIQRLYRNLLLLLEGSSPDLIRRVERHYSELLKSRRILQNRQRLMADIEQGRRRSALGRLRERVRLDPASLLTGRFYRKLLRVLAMAPGDRG